MGQVRNELTMGGLDEVGCFVTALRRVRPDLWEQIQGKPFYDPTKDEKYAAAFILWVFGQWYKEKNA